MKTGIVYAEKGIFAAWPANHGAWQWGDEFLVGFMRGKFKRQSMHNIEEPYQRVFARSMDGGEHWSVEAPNTDFECTVVTDLPPKTLQNAIIRVCGVYDTGGDFCFEGGGFYVSLDKGREWQGPFLLDGLQEYFSDPMQCTARTRVVDDLFFFTDAQRMIWGTDATFCARFNEGKFEFVGSVCADDARAACPAAVKVGNSYVAVLRRRKSGRRDGWIDSCISEDGGKTWSKPVFVASTGSHNGNPPALAATPDGLLVCTFGNRDEGNIIAIRSEDGGRTWGRADVIRASERADVDVGYPQLFVRSDGEMVCVYYFTSTDHPHQHIAYTMFSA